MRKLIGLLIGLAALLLPVSSFASVSNMVAQIGVYNSTDGAYGLEVDNNNAFIFSPTGSSIKYPGTTASTNQTLTATQSGQTIVFNNGAGTAANNTLFTLPSAVVGLQFTIVSDVANSFAIKPQAADIINFNSAAVGQRIWNAGSAIAGDSITLYCATAGKWSIADKSGTWVKVP